VSGQYHTYKPKSDFLVLKFDFPRLAVVVDSHPEERRDYATDYIHLMIQGASIVRFANTMLDAYRKEKNFVFVAIFIRSTALVERHLLYQDEKRDTQYVRTHVIYFSRTYAESP
jgi:hypothetical protein